MALLRESGLASGDAYALGAVMAEDSLDSHVANSGELLAFVDAVLKGDAIQRDSAREAVLKAVGEAAFVDVCATVASFNAVVKIADGSGIPLEDVKAERTCDLRADLGLDALSNR